MIAGLLLKAIAALAIALFVFVQALFFPIAALIHCIRNPMLSTGTKIAWVCLILFTWIFGASIYGIVASQRPLFKWLGILSLAILIPFMLAKKRIATYIAQQQQAIVIRNLDKIQLTDLGDSDRAILKDEITNLDVSKGVSQDLIKLLSEMMRRGHLDRGQLMAWEKFYQSKDTLNRTEVKKYTLKVQFDNLRNR